MSVAMTAMSSGPAGQLPATNWDPGLHFGCAFRTVDCSGANAQTRPSVTLSRQGAVVSATLTSCLDLTFLTQRADFITIPAEPREIPNRLFVPAPRRPPACGAAA
jgi:hypothetical protein